MQEKETQKYNYSTVFENVISWVNWVNWVKHGHLWTLLILLACTAMLLFGFAKFLEDQTETWMHELEVEDLSAQADTVAGFLDILNAAPTPENLNPIIAKVGRNPNFRITVLDDTGTVLADSWMRLDEVKAATNYADRPEILGANLHAAGVSIRYSQTIAKNLMYVTRNYHRDNFSGYIRIATPLSIITADLEELHVELLQVVFIIFSVFCGVALYVFKHVKRADNLGEEQKLILAKMGEQTTDTLLIQKFGQTLNTCESQDELMQVISKMGSHLFGELTAGALAISPSSLDVIEIVATWGEHWPGDERYHPKDCWAFRRGAAHISSSGSMDMQCNHIDNDAAVAVQCVPLQSQGISLGALHISASADVFDNAAFKNKVIAVSEHLCLALANLNLRKKLEQQAIRDPLTYLYNRRYLDDSFTRELKRAERKKTSLGVIMIDIDHFKVFNDTYGHDAGDYVIREFAKLLSNTVRGEDICCRYGGEEFALLLNEIHVSIVVKRATELLQSTRNLVLQHGNKSLGNITISLGIAMYPHHGSTQQELIKAADTALYQAKKAGRDQLKLAESDRLLSEKAA